MSDTSLNKVIQYGTHVERLAFTPDPAVGSQVLYIWYETDTGTIYFWTGAAWVAPVAAAAFPVSAGTSSGTVTRLQFNNGSGVSFGLNGSTITASVKTDYLTNIKISAGTLSNNLSALTFDNGNGVSFGLSGSVLTASINAIAGIQVSAGTQTSVLTGITFSNSNSITFGLSNGTITASFSGGGGGAGSISYFNNGNFPNWASVAFTVQSAVFAPFVLPGVISADMIRFPMQWSFSNFTTSGTSANTTWTLDNYQTFVAGMFTKGTGGSTGSLMSFTNFTGAATFRTVGSHGNTGSHYTINLFATYPYNGSTNTFTASYPITSNSFVFSSSQLSVLGGNNTRFVELPMGTLPMNNYWIGLAMSTASANTGVGAIVNFPAAQPNSVLASFLADTIIRMGNASNTTQGLMIGQGKFTTNAQFSITDQVPLTAISWIAGQKQPYFEMGAKIP